MLIVISPAKSLDFETPLKIKKSSQALFLSEAAKLVEVARKLSVDQIAELMDLSPNLAQLNWERFQNWHATSSQPTHSSDLRQAVFAFNGDVYDGLAVRGLEASQLDYLQKRLRILSGLYGVLRPLDVICPYRLEMGRPLRTSRGNNLYQFWDTQVTLALQNELEANRSRQVLNLASEEYFKVVKPHLLSAKVITPVFQDWKNGQYKVISFFAKRARGLMARFCAVHKIKQAKGVQQFAEDGYQFVPSASDDQQWIFRRRQE